jgi:hypothetical protein
MSLGQMQCIGSTQFLKTTYGAGYKLIFDKTEAFASEGTNLLAKLTTFVQTYIPEAKYFEEDGSEMQILYSLPFDTVSRFGPFFSDLENNLNKFALSSFGVTITSLEDVFLKVGEDHTVTPNKENFTHGIGVTGTSYTFSLVSQIIGLAKRRLTYAMNDFITIPLIAVPMAASIAGVILYNQQTISNLDTINDLVISGMFIGSYLGAPGLIAEFLVRERSDKLRNVLTVMGCDFRAYWIGTFIADYCIMLIPTVALWIMWPAAAMPDFYASDGGKFALLLLLSSFFLSVLLSILMLLLPLLLLFCAFSLQDYVSFYSCCLMFSLLHFLISFHLCLLHQNHVFL